MSDGAESYLGQCEDQHLEFKGPEAPDEDLIMLIVAFLNAGGGRLVVGVTEVQGLAAAEPGVKEPHALLERLTRKMMNQIQPSPAGLVTGRIVITPSGTRLVIFEVGQPTGGPYAMARGTGFHFLVRRGAQVWTMSMREIRRRARESHPSADEPEEVTGDAFRRGISCAAEGAFGEGVAVFVGFHPVRQLPIDPARWPPEHLIKELKSELPFALSPPTPAPALAYLDASMKGELPFALPPGARDWSLGLSPHFTPRHEGAVIRFGREKPLSRFVEIKNTGLVWGAMRLEPGWPGLSRHSLQERHLEPDLLELRVLDRAVLIFLLSVARLAGGFWRFLGLEGTAQARSILFSNHKIGWQSWVDGVGYKPTSDLVDPPVDAGTIQIDARYLASSPDDISIDLLSRLFVATGTDQDASRLLDQLRYG